jgi:hypothetical protein
VGCDGIVGCGGTVGSGAGGIGVARGVIRAPLTAAVAGAVGVLTSRPTTGAGSAVDGGAAVDTAGVDPNAASAPTVRVATGRGVHTSPDAATGDGAESASGAVVGGTPDPDGSTTSGAGDGAAEGASGAPACVGAGAAGALPGPGVGVGTWPPPPLPPGPGPPPAASGSCVASTRDEGRKGADSTAATIPARNPAVTTIARSLCISLAAPPTVAPPHSACHVLGVVLLRSLLPGA